MARHDPQISQLVPLYIMNTLVAIAIGMAVLGEWREVVLWRYWTWRMAFWSPQPQDESRPSRRLRSGFDFARVRTTKDGVLVCLHDAEVDRTTDGKGKVAEVTLADLKKLDAGIRFDAKFKGERVPTLREVLELAKRKIAVMIDLKEDGEEYAKSIAALVQAHGEPKRVVLGIRSVEHAKLFRKLLPDARQIGLVPTADDIEPFARAEVKVIRLWPQWLSDEKLVPRVRKLGLELHLGTGKGTKEEVLPLLVHEPESLSSDDPARLITTLAEIREAKKK